VSVIPVAAPMSVASRAADSICDIYRELESCRELRPSPRVNHLFSTLVRLVISIPDEHVADVLDDPVVRGLAARLRDLCARGEFELEAFWADAITTGADPRAELARFPYLENYRLLCRMELDALVGAVQRPVRSVAFAGSGPLPLSSFRFAQELGVPVDCLDRDPEAVAVSRRLVARLNFGDVRVRVADVAAVDLSGYDVVVLAALVGATPAEKAAVLRQITASMTPGAVVLIRSARGLRTLLYPAVDPQALTGLDIVSVVHPADEVINSAIVARVSGDGPVPGPRPGMEH
jgi:hypothetical protein